MKIQNSHQKSIELEKKCGIRLGSLSIDQTLNKDENLPEQQETRDRNTIKESVLDENFIFSEDGLN